MSETATINEPGRWRQANREHLEAETARLRLLLHRRALWLRRHWRREALQDDMTWRISEAQADRLLSGEDTIGEADFYAADPDAAALTSQLASIEERIDAIAAAMRRAGAPAALDALVQLFGLSRFERDAFLLALMPELNPSFERLYAYVQDDLTRRHATPQLALTLLAASDAGEGDARDCFLPDAALRRCYLLSVDEGAPASAFPIRPLRVDERMLNFALGINRPDERLALLLEAVPPCLTSSDDAELADRIAHWAHADGRLTSRSVNLIGSGDANPSHLARAVCDALGVSVFQLNAAALPPSQSERRELLALIERETVLLQMALYLDLDAVRSEDRRDLARDIDRLNAFCIIGSAVRWPGQRETLTIAVSKPDALRQAELWRQALGKAGLSPNGEIGALVEQFDLDPALIGRAVTAARALAAVRAPGAAVTADDLWRACEQEAAPKLDDLAQRVVVSYSWEDIVLPPQPFQQLQEIAAQVAHRAQVYRDWGFGAKLARGRGISALFAGPSGTGKTMAAEVLARHLRLDLYRIDLAGVVSKYIGETERNLRNIFTAAERGGAILFFDEADALFGKRSEVKDSHDRYANIEVNYLLQRMEDFGGLAILATNRKSALDSAFVRRLRFIIDFPFPDTAHRLRIWKGVFPPQAELKGIDFGWLSRFEIPGGHIRNIALAAAFLAASEGAPIGMLHVMRAARREYGKMDRIVQEADFGPYYATVMS
jgi:winged helix domain-containing protein/ATPase family protein associated with various cellular activities (AAA)